MVHLRPEYRAKGYCARNDPPIQALHIEKVAFIFVSGTIIFRFVVFAKLELNFQIRKLFLNMSPPQ